MAVLGLMIAALGAYLVYALVNPEKLSRKDSRKKRQKEKAGGKAGGKKLCYRLCLHWRSL